MFCFVTYKNYVSVRFSTDSDVPSGMQGGPLALFDKTNNVLIFSALDEFMITSPHLDRRKSRLCHGVMSTVPVIPKMYSYSTVVFRSTAGINEVHVQKDVRHLVSSCDLETPLMLYI